LCFDLHVNSILKLCSHRSFWMKQLCSQGLSNKQLKLYVVQLFYLALACDTSMWYIFIQGAWMTHAFLCRMFSFCYCSQLHSVRQLIAKGDWTLFHTLSQPTHCLYQQLSPSKDTSKPFRFRVHNFVLPSCHFELYKRSFNSRCLFNYV